jgi:PAS domain S-box-containing protein
MQTNLQLQSEINLLRQQLAASETKCQALERQIQIERAAAIAQVHSDQDRLALALESAQIGWWDLDWATRKTIWSPYHEVIFGYEPGRPERDYFDWERCIHPDDLEHIHQATHYARDHRQDLALQYRLIRPDGSVRWVDALGRFSYDPQGQPIRMVGVIRDITELKQAEQALQESEERFRATFEQAAVGIAHVSPQGQWLRVNQKLCEIVGYTSDELLTLTFQEITHPDDLDADLTYVRQLLANEIQTYSMEKRYIHKRGETVWIELTVSLVRSGIQSPDELGTPQYFIAVIEEIGDRKQAETERAQAQADLKARAHELSELNILLMQAAGMLERRNQELDQFVYVVSHDLKAPLRAISNLSEWIEMDLEGQLPPENQQQLQLLRTRTQRMTAMIDGLLNYSRAGRAKMDTEVVEVSELLAEVIDSLNPPPQFAIKITAPMPTLKTKRLLLSQVFANLISNAVKHRDREDGNLEISVQEDANFYEFALKDDGPGIAPEDHERIFMIFRTLRPSVNNESTGVGLSIVRKIIETEGGAIRLESQLQQGTTFYFSWPKQEGSAR